MLTAQMHLRGRDMARNGLPGLATDARKGLYRIGEMASGGAGMMVSPFDLMRATIKVKRPAEPKYWQKTEKTEKPDKRAKVKTARKQRRKGDRP
jgi:hypothetical protein